MHLMCSEHKDFRTPALVIRYRTSGGVTPMTSSVIPEIMVAGHYTRWPVS